MRQWKIDAPHVSYSNQKREKKTHIHHSTDAVEETQRIEEALYMNTMETMILQLIGDQRDQKFDVSFPILKQFFCMEESEYEENHEC